MISSENEIIRYIISGIINTVVGYGVFICLVYLLDVNPFYANAIGYIIALCIAFILNKYFVFNVKNTQIKHFLMFIIAFIVAFFINVIVLSLFLNVLNLYPAIAQIFAMISYTVSFYIFNKFIVFKSVK